MNLNLSKFHKIESDEHATTLEHPNGHLIKVAHKGISPTLKKQLEELPVKMAKGGQLQKGGRYSFKAHAEQYKTQKASGPSKSSNTMPGSPTEAKNAYTEPNAMGTSIPREHLMAELHGGAPYDDVVVNALERKAPPYGPLGAEPKQHYPPCINPSCKSFGKSHPNCRCYGGVPEAGHFAEGGKVDSYCSEDRPHQQGCEYFKNGGGVGKELESEVEKFNNDIVPKPVDNSNIVPETASFVPESEQAPQIDREIAAADQAAGPASPNPEVGQAQTAEELPAPDQTATAAQEPPQPQQPASPEQHAHAVNQHLLQEDAAIQSDINAGHIQPQTYKSLFANESTVGKIGTLFGLLVGGAGAGLSHQPNMIMEMMDNTIKNDLRAQEESAKNKQNLLKINQDAISTLQGANLTEQQAKSLALANTYMQANRLALDSLVKSVQKMPPGPARQQAEATLAILSPMVDKKNMSIAAQAGLASALQSQMGGGGGNTMLMKSGLMGPEMREMGSDIEQKTIPGIPGTAKIPIPQNVREEVLAMNVLSDKAKDLINFAKQNVGTLSPAKRAVAQQKAEEMVNFYNNSIKGGVLTEGRLKWLDDQIKKNPTGIVTQIMGNQQRLQEIMNSNNHRKDILLGSYYGPKAKGASSKTQPAPAETRQYNGATYQKVNGGWQKVK